MIGKKFSILAILLILMVMFAFVFGGCGNGEMEETFIQEEQEEEELIVGSPWFPDNLETIDGATVIRRLGLIDTLVDIDIDGSLVPGLAEDWEVSEDGLTWTFWLRNDVKFHDGVQMDAEAVVKSLVKLNEEGSLFADVPIESISKAGEYLLEIKTKEFFAPLPSYLTKGEAAPFSPNTYNEAGEFETLFGTGPYKFESWEPEQEVVMVKNEEYWGQVPHIERVIYRGIPDASTRMMMLRNNELDIAQILPADGVEDLEKYGDIDIYTKPILRTRLITFNMKEDPFDDYTIRKAVTHAIDRDAIVEHIMAGIDVAAKGLFPSVSEWANEDIEEYPFDQELAEELIGEAGFTRDDDGYYYRNGELFQIDFVTYPERAELPLMAEVIQHQLEEVGIKVNLEIMEYGQAADRRDTGQFDMYLLGRNMGFIPDPGLILMEDYHSKNTDGPGFGAYAYANEELDEILEKAASSPDVNERRQFYYRAQELLVEDLPILSLSHYVNVDAAGSHVHGYQMHPMESTFYLEKIYFE